MKLKNGELKNCKACTKEFYVPAYRILTAKFCSLKCQNHVQYDKYIFICKTCNKEVIASPCRRKERKKFCSLLCRENNSANEKERRKKTKAYNLLKRGYNSSRQLRKYISQFKQMKCEICGYFEYDFCLDMHHKDHDPLNNSIENIGILCVMCHRKLHKGLIKFKDEL